MKAKSFLVTLLMAVLFAGCYKDDIDDIKDNVDNITNRLETLEQWMNETNTNIVSLQTIVTALEKKDYITEVTPLADNTGYEINFSQSGKITIYNGKNGTNGYTPEITIKKDKDGKYCWTLDGEFITDADGKNISAMGLMPQLKIESDYWYISYYGKTWTKLGKAKGEDGADGEDGSNGWGGATGAKGDSMFKKVEVSADKSSVTFTLSSDESTFTLPLTSGLISFQVAGLYTMESTTAELIVNIPEDYQSLIAKIEPIDDNFDILTKGSTNGWSVKIEEGSTAKTAKVTISFDNNTATTGYALVTVVLVDKNDQTHSITKIIKMDYVYLSTTKTYYVYTTDGLLKVNDLIMGISDVNTQDYSANITLKTDITLPDPIAPATSNWMPIGGLNYLECYKGTFDGNNHIIKNLIVENDDDYVGLITNLEGYVKNLTMENCMVKTSNTSSSDVGIIAGRVFKGKVVACTVLNSTAIASKGYAASAGGIAGSNYKGGIISSCIVKNSIITANNWAGGIVGSNYGNDSRPCIIVGCLAINVTTTFLGINTSSLSSVAGGIVGNNSSYSSDSYYAKVIGSYAYQCKTGETTVVPFVTTANVTGENNNEDTGTDGTITSCYYYAADATNGKVSSVNGTGEPLTKEDNIDWSTAVSTMNAAISSATLPSGLEKYKWGGSYNEPTLTKLD